MNEADPRIAVVRRIIEEVRPSIRADGGDIEFVGIEGRRVEVRLTGRCLSCALAGQTLGAIRRRLTAALDDPVMVVPFVA